MRTDSSKSPSRSTSGQLPPLPESGAALRQQRTPPSEQAATPSDTLSPSKPGVGVDGASSGGDAESVGASPATQGLQAAQGQSPSPGQQQLQPQQPSPGPALSPALRAVRQYIGLPYTKGHVAAAFRDLLRLVSILHPNASAECGSTIVVRDWPSAIDSCARCNIGCRAWMSFDASTFQMRMSADQHYVPGCRLMIYSGSDSNPLLPAREHCQSSDNYACGPAT